MLGLSRPPRYHSRSRATSRAPGLGDARSQGDSFYRLHALNYHRKSHTRTPRTMDDSHPANPPPLARRGKEICGHCSSGLWLLI